MDVPLRENTLLYPLMLKLHGKRCVIIGGGEVAARKAGSLLAAGAQLTVVAPEFAPQLVAAVRGSACTLVRDNYQAAYLAQAFLVVAATDDSAVNRQACLDAPCLCNNITEPQLGNFLVPAAFSRQDLSVAVACNGMPAFARLVRDYLQGALPPAVGEFNAFLRQKRAEVQQLPSTPAERSAFWRTALTAETVTLLAGGKLAAAKEQITDAVNSFRAQSQNGAR